MNDRQFETTGSLNIDLESELEHCHTDPIHQSALIQPHGTFLELDPESLEIRSAASNVEQFLDAQSRVLIGNPLADCIPSSTLVRLREYLNSRFPDPQHFVMETGDSVLNMHMFPVGDRAGLEVEPRRTSKEGADLLITNLSDQLDHLLNQNHRDTLFARALESIQSFTSYNRLLVYQFDEEGHGSVVAEQKDDNLTSYLDLQFPATDIPEPARRIYRKNGIRVIPTVEYEPIPILGPDGPRQREELDLTYADLRSVPDIHRQYMSNMGVQGSLSLSLLIDGELWGMISCHSMSPHYLDQAEKSACKQIARTTAQQIQKLIAGDRERQYNKIAHIRDHMEDRLTNHEHLFEQLRNSSKSILTLMGATAFYLRMEDESLWLSEKDETRQHASSLIGDIEEHLQDHRTCTVESIVEEWDEDWFHSASVSGFYARRFASSASSYCIWFRPEHRETIDWGGDPRSPVEVSEGGELSPRSSFDAWTQVVSGTCRRWTDLDDFTTTELCRHLKELEIELQKSLLEETNQRVESKNASLERTKKRLKKINKEKEELIDQVREMARTDDLTGLLNRDELEEQLSEEFERAQRYDHKLSVVFMDLDHFKQVNDRYGHQAGDDVLAETGRKLQALSRTSDTIGRYGGEEFVAVLPETDIEHAVAFAERFSDELRDHTFDADGESFQLTCSIGIAGFRESDRDPESIVDRADTALYRAKNSGRDTICIAGETDERGNRTGS